MARQQHLGQAQGERLDPEEVNIGNKTMQQEVSLNIDMVNIISHLELVRMTGKQKLQNFFLVF